MHSFTDKNGRVWEIELTVGLMEYVQSRLEVDLFDPVTEERSLIVELAPISLNNVKLFANLLFVLCEEQCKASDPEIVSLEFGKLLLGKALRGAYEAFYSEWQDFFLGLGRTDLAETIGKMNSLLQEGISMATKGIKELTFENLESQTTKAATS
jgi:hypothetical protein